MQQQLYQIWNDDRNKDISIRIYLQEIKAYLEDVINHLQKYDIWKIQLAIAIKSISSRDINEKLVMHSKSDNIKVMAYDKADEVIQELFEPILYRYQIELEIPIKGSNFIFHSVYKFHCKLHQKILSVGDHI